MFYEIYKYLSFYEIGVLQTVCKNFPQIHIKYDTFCRSTKYLSINNISHIEKSYLLTNGKKEKPSQIKNNFLDIKLYRGDSFYHFTIYKDIYKVDKDILHYLKNLQEKNCKKVFLKH